MSHILLKNKNELLLELDIDFENLPGSNLNIIIIKKRNLFIPENTSLPILQTYLSVYYIITNLLNQIP